MQKRVTSFRIEPELLARLEYAAREGGVTKGELVNKALSLYLAGDADYRKVLSEGLWTPDFERKFEASLLEQIQELGHRVSSIERELAELKTGR